MDVDDDSTYYVECYRPYYDGCEIFSDMRKYSCYCFRLDL